MAHYSSQVFSPLITVWTSPKRTMQQIIERGGDYQANWLFFIAGACGALRSQASEGIEFWGLPGFFFLSLFLGGLAGIIINNIFVFFIQSTPKWFGGNGELVHTRNAVAWALLPALFAIPIFILKLYVFGKELTIQDPENQAQYYMAWGIYFFQFIPWVWSIILLVNTLSVVQKYSRLQAFFHQVTAGLIFSSPFWIIFGLFYLLRS